MSRGNRLAAVPFCFFMLGASAHSSFAAEMCGLETAKGGTESNDKRFVILSDYGNRAFLDMRTCMVWDLNPASGATWTLDQATEVCTMNFQGGYEGEMGWRIPTADELTSLDSKSWGKQKEEFKEFKLPPIERDDAAIWTSSPWLGKSGEFVSVSFGGRTTYTNSKKPEMKAGLWCVRGYRATGLR